MISFAVPNISWGGHVGGLIAGTLIGLAFERGRRIGQGWIFWVTCVGVAAAAVAGALAVAGGNGL